MRNTVYSHRQVVDALKGFMLDYEAKEFINKVNLRQGTYYKLHKYSDRLYGGDKIGDWYLIDWKKKLKKQETPYKKKQLDMIDKGKRLGVDTSVYESNKFNYLQMSIILKGLIRGLDVTVYAKPELSASEMDTILSDLILDKED